MGNHRIVIAGTAISMCVGILLMVWLPSAPAQTTPQSFGGGTTAAPGLTVQRAVANVAASQTDSVLVTGVTGKRVKVLGMVAICGSTATNLTLNTKGTGAGTAISPVFPNGGNGGFLYPMATVETAWLATEAGESLTCTTGAGSTTAIQLVYVIE